MYYLFSQFKLFWDKIINIGITPIQSFTEKKKIHLLNGLAVVGGIGTSIYMIIMFLLAPPHQKLTAIDPFYYLNFILISTFAIVLYLNSLHLYNWARTIGLIIVILFYTYVGLHSGKPYEGEMFMLVIAVFVFVMFNKNKHIIPIFLLATTCFFVLLINIALKNNQDFGYIINAGVYIRVATLFIFLFFTLNLFRLEHLNNQKEIERKNEMLQEQQNELISQSEMLEEQKSELIKLNQTKDKLFSIIGHDLRTPIGGLKLIVDFLDEDTLSYDNFSTFTADLKKNVDSAYQMLENLLEWSQTQLHGISTNPTHFNIADLVNENILLFSDIAKKKKITLTNEIKEEILVYADFNHLRLILRNLISNAIKFTPQNCKISISAQVQEEFVIISVIDTGLGIAQNQIDNLFKQDIILSKKGTEGERGTGLGLLLVKEFVEKNHGKIWVESEEGKGSTFYFTLKRSTQILY